MPGRTGERARTVPTPPPTTAASPKAERAKAVKQARDGRRLTGGYADRESALTAAAQVYESDGSVTATAALTAGTDVSLIWQTAVLGYARAVPELSAATMFVGNACSMVELELGRRNIDGTTEPAYRDEQGDTPTLVEGLDPKVATAASEAIARIRMEIGGQSEFLRSYAEKAFLLGESFIVPRDTPGGLTFDPLSRFEVRRETGGRGKEDKWFRVLGPGQRSDEPLDAPPIRVYRPDPQWSMLPTSSPRGCLEILEELVILTRLVRGSALSRMSLAGMLIIADEADDPIDNLEGADDAEASNPLLVDIINAGIKAIDDPASPAAFMPYMLQIPKDLVKDGVEYIQFEKDDSISIAKRDEAVARLARGLDMPYEKVVGHQSCVDTDTEILTARGWLRYDEVREGDEILTLSHGSRRATKAGKPTAEDRDADGSGLAEWQTVERVSVYDVEDQPMLSLEGKSHSSLSTMNHWWPMISGRGKQNWVQSDGIKSHHRIVPAAPCADLPAEAKWSDDFVALVGWFWTEGSYNSGTDYGYIAQSRRANPQHVAAIRGVLTRLFGPPEDSLHAASRSSGRPVCSFPECGWPTHGGGLCNAHRAQKQEGIELRPVNRSSEQPENADRRRAAWREHEAPGDMVHFILNTVLMDQLRGVCSNPEKVVSHDFLRTLTAGQLELFIATSVNGDGWQDPARPATAQLHQSDQARAEAFGFACHLAGRAVSYRTVEGDGTFGASTRHQVLTRRAAPMRVGFTMDQSEVSYTGKVWCPTVANGTWLARRHGTVYFTGNTTFANAAQVDLDSYRIHIQPLLKILADAAVAAIVWPAVAKALGLDPAQVRQNGYPPEVLAVGIHLNPAKLVAQPDRTKDLIEAYRFDQSQTAIANAELRGALGLDPNGGPDDDEIAKRVSQIQLVKERITVASPTNDTIDDPAGATPILPPVVASAADEALIGLVYRIAGAAEQTVERAVEKVGAKARQRARGTEAEMLGGRANHEVPRILGPERTQRLVDGDPVAAEVEAFTRLVLRWAVEAAHPQPNVVADTFSAFLTGVISKRLYELAPEVSPEMVRPLVLGVTTAA